MKKEDFDKILDDQLVICLDILVKKAKEYATEDRLHNFKVAGHIQACTPEKALAGMMCKHTVSIYDMCNSQNKYPMALWDEKITDNINYMLLLKALVTESSQE